MGAQRGIGLMSELGAREFRRQGRATRFARCTGLTFPDIIAEIVKLRLYGSEIGIDGFIEQAELIGVEPRFLLPGSLTSVSFIAPSRI